MVGWVLATLIRAGHTLKNQGVKQSGAQALSRTEFGTWRGAEYVDWVFYVWRGARGSKSSLRKRETVVMLLSPLVRAASIH
jgi:hypothetical protein